VIPIPHHTPVSRLALKSGQREVWQTLYRGRPCATRILTSDRMNPVFAGLIKSVVVVGKGSAVAFSENVQLTLEGYRVATTLAAALPGPAPWPRVVDAGLTDEGYVYVTTEWMDGETLHRLPIDASLRFAVAQSLGSVLATLHHANVAYGDLKTENLVIDAFGNVSLIDLDTLREVPGPLLAVPLRDLTPEWAAPEQRNEQRTYLASDIWAFGILIRRLFAEDVPEPWQTLVAACRHPLPLERPNTTSLLRRLHNPDEPLLDWHDKPVRLHVADVADARGSEEKTERVPEHAAEPNAGVTERVPESAASTSTPPRLPAFGSAVGGSPRIPNASPRVGHVLRWVAGVGGILVLIFAGVALRPTEVPDGKDNDWDGVVDEGTELYDDDLDGYSEKAGDCDDASPARSPGVAERCSTPNVDDNCDGNVEEEGAADGTLYYYDHDGDGYGAVGGKIVSPRRLCGIDAKSFFTAERAGDCYDRNADANPDAQGVFDKHRGDGSFDYDCDGREQLSETTTMTCSSLGWAATKLDCYVERKGWQEVVPSCGSTGAWGAGPDDCEIKFLNSFVPSCEPTAHENRTQLCK
jgi:hypothetical protein